MTFLSRFVDSIGKGLTLNTEIVQVGPGLTTLPEAFGPLALSGVQTSQTRALQLSAVWACIRLRAETIGATPVHVVESEGTNRERQEAPAWLQRPNPETTRMELFERTATSLDIDGNAFWFTVRGNNGRVMEVWNLAPGSIAVKRDRRTKRRYYECDGRKFDGTEIIHIPGFTLPGHLRGMNPIQQHRHAIGLTVAAEEYGESFFRNGATMSGVITMDQDPGEDNANRMRQSFADNHQGVQKAHLPGVLFGGAGWEQLTIPNEQAQFLETRKFQTNEIARIFRVPPHKIGDLEKATYSNIEHQGIQWVTDGLIPYTARIEAAAAAADGLLDRGQHLRFNFAGQLRGDTGSRYAAYATARQWGWLSIDDIRALEDMNPLPDGAGEAYLEPLNMRHAGAVEDDAVQRAQALASVLQKLYLGVGSVITEAEARNLLRDAGYEIAPGEMPTTAATEPIDQEVDA